MTSITNYEYYKNTFGGTLIPSESFKRLEIKATSDFNYFTSSRVSSNEQVTNDIKNVICEICELKYQQEQYRTNITKENIVQSETVGSHSVTYGNNGNNIMQQILSDEEMMSKEYQICLIGIADKNLMSRIIK